MNAVGIRSKFFAAPVGAMGVFLVVGCRAAGIPQVPVRLVASWATPDSPPPEGSETATAPRPSSENWHVDLAIRGSYTKLGGTKQTLDRRLDIPMRLDWAGVFDHPYSPLDRRSDLGMTTWSLGVGRQEGEHWVWTLYGGGGTGQDLNHQRFLNTTLKVDFRYAYAYTGLTAEYYPWSVPDASNLPWRKRLAASRPFLLAGFETGYVSGEGEGDYKVSGALLYHDEQKVRDWLASVILGAGWSVPFSDHWSLNLSGDYRFHAYRPYEYNGWNWTTAVRYRF